MERGHGRHARLSNCPALAWVFGFVVAVTEWWTYIQGKSKIGFNRDDPPLRELEQQLMVYSVGALSMLLCDARARVSLASPPGSADHLGGVTVEVPRDLFDFQMKNLTTGRKGRYRGRLATQVGRPLSARGLHVRQVVGR